MRSDTTTVSRGREAKDREGGRNVMPSREWGMSHVALLSNIEC
jgi:hypothetical protein